MLMNTYTSVIKLLIKLYLTVKMVNHHNLLYLIIIKLYCPDYLVQLNR